MDTLSLIFRCQRPRKLLPDLLWLPQEATPCSVLACDVSCVLFRFVPSYRNFAVLLGCCPLLWGRFPRFLLVDGEFAVKVTIIIVNVYVTHLPHKTTRLPKCRLQQL
jgi:hypothetical protein